MNILLATESFVVRESLENLFKDQLDNPQILSITDITKINLEKINHLDFIFVDIKGKYDKKLKKLNKAKVRFKDVKIMILDNKSDKFLFQEIVKLGVEGYITEFSQKEEFVFILKKVLQGQKIYESKLVQSMLLHNEKKNINTLTKREIDVFIELGKCITNKQIAENLYITEYTVKKHISNILDKLNLKNRQEAILYLINNPI